MPQSQSRRARAQRPSRPLAPITAGSEIEAGNAVHVVEGSVDTGVSERYRLDDLDSAVQWVLSALRRAVSDVTTHASGLLKLWGGQRSCRLSCRFVEGGSANGDM